MGFFGRKQPEKTKDDSISTAEWQSLASGGDSSRILKSEREDSSGFVNPEGPMGLGESAWAQERRAQQMELEEVHNHRKERGCFSHFVGWTIKGLHVMDVCLGITLIVYGSLLRTQFEQPAMAAVVFCMLLGTILLVSSGVGIFSYVSPSCSRWGLLVSGMVAPYLCVVYVTMIIALCMDSSGLFMYLEDHHEVMYFGEDVVTNLKGVMPLVYSILGVLAYLELVRTFVTLDTRKALMSKSSAEALIPRSGYTSVPSPPDTLKEPLLEEKVTSSSYAPSDEEQKKEVAETPEWWKG